jgi:uncharacterized protein (DUF2384 family)
MAGTSESGTARQGERTVPFAEPLTNYQTLVQRVVDAFGDELKASRWLSLPNDDLGGESPLQVFQRDHYSTLHLEPILVRIEHGIDY